MWTSTIGGKYRVLYQDCISPDVSLADIVLFPGLRRSLTGSCFDGVVAIQRAVTESQVYQEVLQFSKAQGRSYFVIKKDLCPQGVLVKETIAAMHLLFPAVCVHRWGFQFQCSFQWGRICPSYSVMQNSLRWQKNWIHLSWLICATKENNVGFTAQVKFLDIKCNYITVGISLYSMYSCRSSNMHYNQSALAHKSLVIMVVVGVKIW